MFATSKRNGGKKALAFSGHGHRAQTFSFVYLLLYSKQMSFSNADFKLSIYILWIVIVPLEISRGDPPNSFF